MTGIKSVVFIHTIKGARIMEKEPITSLSYNQDYYAVMANKVIRGKQSMSLQSARLIRLLVTQIAKSDTDTRTYSCKITELARFLNVSQNNMYRDIRDICENLMKSCVYIGTDDPKQKWKLLHWVSTAEYDGNGTVTLRLSKEVNSFVVELDRWFTLYQLKNILYFKSFYSIRMYEIILSSFNESQRKKEGYKFTVDELREWLGCEKKYKLFGDFKKRAIEPSIDEINEKSDIYISFVKYHKTGKSITAIEFFVIENPNNKNE